MQARIIVDPIPFITVLTCQVRHTVNQHIEAEVCGYVQDQENDLLYRNWGDTAVSIYEEKENGEKLKLFTGMLRTISMEEESDVRKLSFSAVSFTALLDQKRKTCAFQDRDQTIYGIAAFVAGRNKRASYIFQGDKTKKPKGLLVQYKETDWEFLIRLASCANTCMIADCTNNNACFYFGLPQKDEELTLKPVSFHVRKSMDTPGVMDFYISSGEYAQLCTPVKFQGKSLLIMESISTWEKGELIHQYRMREKSGFAVDLHRNTAIAGVSMRGNVTDVKEDKVKVKIEGTCKGIDEKPMWFDYATVYSSQGSAGWYCMPEPGDQVRVYFPDECEEHGFVISAVHMGDQRGWNLNPEEKFIRTVDDKEVRLSPEEITITNHKGMSIVINDKKGISIKSNGNIQVQSGEAVHLHSGERISVEGKGGVFLMQNNNMVAVCNGILEKGNKVEHQ